VRRTDSFEFHRLLAVAHYRLGDFGAASDALDRALEIRTDFPVEAVRLRASIDHDREEWIGALQALTALSARGHGLSGNEQVMHARALYELDRAEQGRRVLEKALGMKHPPVTAAIEFARRESAAHPDEARAHLVAAITENPGSYEGLNALVELELRSGRLMEALYLVNNSVKAGRARPETLLLRARILTETKQYEAAEADALRAFEADPNLPGSVDLLYSIYAAQGRLEEAKVSFEEADAAGVLHPGARLLLSRIYLREGDVPSARTMLRKILSEDPQAASAKADLAVLIADNGGNLDRAVELAEEAQKSLRSDPAAADTLGYVYLRKGLHEAALQQFLYGIELNDDLSGTTASSLHYHKGLTLDALSRSNEAAEAFEKALALDANFPEADDARERLGRSGRPS
jgi:tetratricopeptide (TPR) repeat protein